MVSDIYSPVCRYVITPLWAKWERSQYLKYYEEQKSFQFLDRGQIENFQFQKIKSLLEHAYHNCPFYKDFYFSAGIHPEDIKTWSDFRCLPMLTKTMIRKSQGKIIAQNIPRQKLVPGKTSGSTGKPLDFFIDEDSTQKQRASALLTKEWAGYRLGEKVFTLFGQSTSTAKRSKLRKYLRRKLLNRTYNLSTLQLNRESMMKFYGLLCRNPMPFITGYAHTLYLFAEFLEQQNLEINARGIISGGMVLHNWQREKIEKVFNCKVINRYGCEELGTIACECARQEGLHVNSYTKYVEVINENGERAQPGEVGSLIVTDLTNYGMPFIRYNIEDMAMASDKICSCGRGLPLLARIEGRETDFAITPDGMMVSGISLTDNFGANIPGVVQLQIIQDKIDHITIRIVKDSSFSQESIDTIGMLNRTFFGDKMKFSCDFVNEIPIDASGKIRFVISEIERNT
jgi:phenylacetate-CoA ligase